MFQPWWKLMVGLALLWGLTLPASAANWALLVGINRYQDSHIPPLRGCEADARRIAQVLNGKYDFYTRPLLGENATRANTMRKLAEIRDQARPEDAVVFYFSGHGAHAEDQDGDEEDGYDETLVLYDSIFESGDNDLLDDELHDWVRSLPTENVTVILDTCFAGLASRAGPAIRSKELNRVQMEKAEEQTVQLEKGIVLAACQGNEVAQDVQIGQDAAGQPVFGGVFTYFLSQALTAASPQDTYYSLTQNLVNTMRTTRDWDQTPTLWGPHRERPLFAPIPGTHPPGDGDEESPGSGDSSLPPEGPTEPPDQAGESPPPGVQIIERQGDQVIINAGRSQNVTVGSIYAVYAASAGSPPQGEPVGRIQIGTVFVDQAIAKIVEGESHIGAHQPVVETEHALPPVVLRLQPLVLTRLEAVESGARDIGRVRIEPGDQLPNRVQEALQDHPSFQDVEWVGEGATPDRLLVLEPGEQTVQVYLASRDLFARGTPYTVDLTNLEDDQGRPLGEVLGPEVEQVLVHKMLADLQNPGQTFQATVTAGDRPDPEYHVGQIVTIEVTANVDCYVTVVDVGTSGKASLLFPYPEDDPRLQAHELKTFRGRILPPPGLDQVRVIATLQPLVEDMEDKDGRALLAALRRSLMERPPEDWATAAVGVLIRP